MKTIFKFILDFFSLDRFELKILVISIFVLALSFAISIAAPALQILIAMR